MLEVHLRFTVPHHEGNMLANLSTWRSKSCSYSDAVNSDFSNSSPHLLVLRSSYCRMRVALEMMMAYRSYRKKLLEV